MSAHTPPRAQQSTASNVIECYCTECDGVNTTCLSATQCFVQKTSETEYKQGCGYQCIGASCSEPINSFFDYCGGEPKHQLRYCCKTDFCNVKSAALPYKSRDSDSQLIYSITPTVDVNKTLYAGIFVPVGISVIIIIILCATYYRRREKLQKPNERILQDYESHHEVTTTRDFSVTSGSGSGGTTLTPDSVSKQLKMTENIGSGRYGNVCRATYRDEEVAVKLYKAIDEQVWRDEVEIYNSPLFRHKNILGYIISDIYSYESITKYIIVTDFHQLGSIYDYFKTHQVSPLRCLSLLSTSAAGLSHLHTNIRSGLKDYKPEIAHRDIKTKNILVKSDGEACIADFGIALSCDQVQQQPKVRLLVGTKRYMAPEVLLESINPRIFNEFKLADVYSFSLVIWECVNNLKAYTDGYKLPFSGQVRSDPSVEEMYRAVVTNKYRPALNVPHTWLEHNEVCDALNNLMMECWNEEPEARLSMLRIKKNLQKFYNIHCVQVAVLDSNLIAD